MAWIDHYTIPIRGLYQGEHLYHFSMDEEFFHRQDDEMIKKGKFEVDVVLNKHHDMIEMHIDFTGHCNTICDRCGVDINLPLKGAEDLIFKYKDEESDEGEIIFIFKERAEINIAPYIKETILLHLPIQNVYRCDLEEPRPCDMLALNKLHSEPSDQEDDLSIWDSLKGVDLDN